MKAVDNYNRMSHDRSVLTLCNINVFSPNELIRDGHSSMIYQVILRGILTPDITATLRGWMYITTNTNCMFTMVTPAHCMLVNSWTLCFCWFFSCLFSLSIFIALIFFYHTGPSKLFWVNNIILTSIFIWYTLTYIFTVKFCLTRSMSCQINLSICLCTYTRVFQRRYHNHMHKMEK